MFLYFFSLIEKSRYIQNIPGLNYSSSYVCQFRNCLISLKLIGATSNSIYAENFIDLGTLKFFFIYQRDLLFVLYACLFLKGVYNTVCDVLCPYSTMCTVYVYVQFFLHVYMEMQTRVNFFTVYVDQIGKASFGCSPRKIDICFRCQLPMHPMASNLVKLLNIILPLLGPNGANMDSPSP